MSTGHPRLLARVFIDRVLWFMATPDGLIAHGTLTTAAELRGVQVRAGIVEVALDGLQLVQSFADWRACGGDEVRELEIFFAQASREISDDTPGKITEGKTP